MQTHFVVIAPKISRGFTDTNEHSVHFHRFFTIAKYLSSIYLVCIGPQVVVYISN